MRSVSMHFFWFHSEIMHYPSKGTNIPPYAVDLNIYVAFMLLDKRKEPRSL